ncbi:MAG: hypothetical protein Wins2KO_22890 [Winogradskyella sp.]
MEATAQKNKKSYVNIVQNEDNWSIEPDDKKTDYSIINKYKLPDAHRNAYTIYRRYDKDSVSMSKVIELNGYNYKIKKIRFRAKFSNSDIDQTNDTLKLEATLFNKNNIEKAIKSKLIVTDSVNHFEYFNLNFNEVFDLSNKSKLTIRITVISGSDDSFYLGNSYATIDEISIY